MNELFDKYSKIISVLEGEYEKEIKVLEQKLGQKICAALAEAAREAQKPLGQLYIAFDKNYFRGEGFLVLLGPENVALILDNFSEYKQLTISSIDFAMKRKFDNEDFLKALEKRENRCTLDEIAEDISQEYEALEKAIGAYKTQKKDITMRLKS